MQRLLIAIPAYNEEALLDASIRALVSYTHNHLSRFTTTIVIADNGSTDRTSNIGKELAAEFKHVVYRRIEERGKGRAIRTAWTEHDADIYAFMDADLATDLSALPALLDTIRHGADAAVGSRFHKESTVSRSRVRTYASWAYRYLLHALLDIETEDLPCGFKAVKADIVRKIIPTVQDNGWFFDTECIVRAEKAGYIVQEVPIMWRDTRSKENASKVSIGAVAKTYIRKTWELRKQLAQTYPTPTPLLITKRDTPWVLLFGIIILFLYGSTLGHGFVHDDKGQIVENPYVHSLKYIGRAFSGCIWEGQMACESSAYYRPLHNLSYIVTDVISSSARWYHVVNLMYFLITATLVFGLMRHVTKKTGLAFMAVFIFLFHPINTEVVNWVACVPEFLVTICSILGIAYYIRFNETKQGKYLAGAITSYCVGLLAKETAASLPFMFLFVDIVLYKKNLKTLWRETRAIYATIAGVFVVYFIMRASVLGGFGIGAGNGRFGTTTIAENTHAYVTLFFAYIKKLLLPWPLLGFYPFSLQSNFTSPAFILAFAVTVLFIAATAILLYAKKQILALALVWIPVFLLPVLIFFNRIGENVFAERYLFLPSIGLSLAIAYILHGLWQKNTITKGVVVLIAISIAVAGTIAIHARNKAWKTDYTFYTDILTKNPGAYSILYNLANDYLHAEDYATARANYEKIVANDPQNINIAKVYNNLGMTYIKSNPPDRQKAIEYFKKATTAVANPPQDAWTNLGAAYIESREYLNALQAFCMASATPGTGDDASAAFKELATVVTKAKEKQPLSVYNDVMHGASFQKKEEAALAFSSGGCDPSGCYYVFTTKNQKDTTAPLLTPLIFITSQAKNNQLIPVRRTRIDHAHESIIVETDPQYTEPMLTFLFPDCRGTYSEVGVIKQ